MEANSDTIYNRAHSKEKLLTGVIIAITAVSLFVSSACKVMLPSGKVVSRSAYLEKRKHARKKCDQLLPNHLKSKDFDDIYCHPCTSAFKACIDEEFKR